MSDCCSPRPAAARPGWLRSAATTIEWAVPITTLALVPKCPACVAGYVLLFTGVGLSLPAAAAVRWALIGLSVAALAVLIRRRALKTKKPLELIEGLDG
jgi:hypothetical protein